METGIALILAQDGVGTGAVYALLAVALVMVFAVTRVIFIPQGELVAFGALTVATVQAGRTPATAALLAFLAAASFALLLHARRDRLREAALREVLHCARETLLVPALIVLAALLLPLASLPLLLQVALGVALVAAMGAPLYRLVYQPVAHQSVLVLLVVSAALHVALMGLGLVMFGAEGMRSRPFTDAQLAWDAWSVSGQTLIVIAASALAMVSLAAFFGWTLAGKALRAAAVNPLGARLMGIEVGASGRLAFVLAATVGGLSGALIGPSITIYYDSGFLIGLKGFVAGIIGGLASYPVAAAGALLVGLIESFASYGASAFKEVLVFTLILPVLFWRSTLSHSVLDEEEHA